MNPKTWPPLLVVDVEGNGAHPPELVEIAALPVQNGAPDIDAAGCWMIRPQQQVTPFAARMHGLTNRVLATCPPWPAVAEEVRTFLGGTWVCAHNAHVDYGALSAHLPGWQPAGVLDTLRLARATYPKLGSYSLDALIEHERLDMQQAPGQRHRAAYDAYAACLLLLALARHYTSWTGLAAAAVPPGLPGTSPPEQEATLW